MMTIRRLVPQTIIQAKELVRFFQEEDGMEEPEMPTDEYLTTLLQKSDFIMLAALDDTQLIGGLTAYVLSGYKTEKQKVFLYEIGVRPAWRRRGVAKRLVQNLLEQCRKPGIGKVFLETSRQNTAAVKLFESAGGRPHPDSIAFSFAIFDF